MTHGIRMRLTAVAILSSLPVSLAFAQTPGLPIPGDPGRVQFPPSLKEYLALSDDQVSRINELNQKLTEFQISTLQKQVTLQVEIVRETLRETLDPMALGVRYAELERLRRGIEEERAKTVTSAQQVLTEVQKGKLLVLQQVIVDYPVACTAVNQNLMTVPPVFRVGAINPNLPPEVPAGQIVDSFASVLLPQGSPCPSSGTFATRVALPISIPVPQP